MRVAEPMPRLIEVFSQAVELASVQARAGFLDAACGHDRPLRARVEELLGAHARVNGFLDAPAAVRGLIDEAAGMWVGPGQRIGPYELLEVIGEGGMGVVHAAQQHEPVRRVVALKVIKPGMDSRAVLARFDTERQALALMDHPHIARVLDGGTTAAGLPFFVMELVQGARITEHCDRERLPLRDRLELFARVCRAVQHAHQKGIIHRDLKPSNVLVAVVDGCAVPKVIDFGVAKALSGPLADETQWTAHLQVLGTPPYMSPEQADGVWGEVDTRSDIYALGVLLYQILTGTTPFDPEVLRRSAPGELRRILREVEPPRPSERVQALGAARADLAARRRTDPRRLERALRGELDWIVMRCLEKDRNRRYETANGLAADVMRYLAGQPVEAGPPSRWYRWSRFARRNRVALATTGIVVVTVLAGGIVSGVLAIRAARAEARAESEYRLAQATLDRVVDRVTTELGDASQSARLRRAVLDDALGYYNRILATHGPSRLLDAERARAILHLSSLHMALGDFDQAEEQTRLAIAGWERLVATDPAEPESRMYLSRAYNQLGHLLDQRGEREAGIVHRRRALEHARARAGLEPRDPLAHRELASQHANLGLSIIEGHAETSPEAETHLRTALTIWNRTAATFPDLPEDLIELGRIHFWLGEALVTADRWDEANRIQLQALDLLNQEHARHGASPRLIERLVHARSRIASNLVARGQHRDAEPLLREAIALAEPLWRASPDVQLHAYRLSQAYRGLGFCLWQMGRHGEAAELLRREIEVRALEAQTHAGQGRYINSHAKAYCHLAMILDEGGDQAGSAQALGRALQLFEQLVGLEPGNAKNFAEYAWWLCLAPTEAMWDAGRALKLAARAVEIEPGNAVDWRVLGLAHFRAGDLGAAKAALERSLELDPRERAAALILAMTCARLGEIEAARKWHARGIEAPGPWFVTDRLNRRFARQAIELIEARARLPRQPGEINSAD